MPIEYLLRRNEYHDSIYLMRVAQQMGKSPGVRRVALVMGTPANKALLKDMELLGDEAASAGPNDLLIAVSADDDVAHAAARTAVGQLLSEKHTAVAGTRECRSLEAARALMPGVNLAVISLPGAYATAEAVKALNHGLNVFMFSDDIPTAEEVMLKRLAEEKGRLMMGPGCGLTYLHQTAIGLASKVLPGPIGLVAASGSGLQETMVLIDRAGSGVSQAIGAGGRDLRDEVGGLTTLQALDLLEADPETTVIVLISKPPGLRTAQVVLERIRSCKKPVVVNFIGGAFEPILAAGAQCASTFEEAADRAVALARGERYQPRAFHMTETEVQSLVARERAGYSAGQRFLRGIFCGGTLAEEAMMVMQPWLPVIHSNTAIQPENALADARFSLAHAIVDIGTEEFTTGRPHAAIDPTPRLERFATEAADPTVAIILLDFLLGYGCHPNPAGIMAKPISQAIDAARTAGRRLTVVASLCGTEHDPQRASVQRQQLIEAGALVLPSNAQAARLAGMIAAASSGRNHLT